MSTASKPPGDQRELCLMCDTELKPDPMVSNTPCPQCKCLVWFHRDVDGSVECFEQGMMAAYGPDDKLAWASLHLQGQLILDFRNVPQLYSMALGRLVRIQQRLGQQRRLKLLLHPDLYKTFQITRLDKMFEIERG